MFMSRCAMSLRGGHHHRPSRATLLCAPTTTPSSDGGAAFLRRRLASTMASTVRFHATTTATTDAASAASTKMMGLSPAQLTALRNDVASRIPAQGVTEAAFLALVKSYVPAIALLPPFTSASAPERTPPSLTDFLTENCADIFAVVSLPSSQRDDGGEEKHPPAATGDGKSGLVVMIKPMNPRIGGFAASLDVGSNGSVSSTDASSGIAEVETAMHSALSAFRRHGHRGSGETSACRAAGDRREWVDLEDVLSHAAANSPGHGVATAGSSRAAILSKYLSTADVSALDALKGVLEWEPRVILKPKRPQRTATVFIQADGLLFGEVIETLDRLRVSTSESSVSVMRQATTPALAVAARAASAEAVKKASTAATQEIAKSLQDLARIAHQQATLFDRMVTIDRIAPYGVPTYAVVELEAKAFKQSQSLVLNDVVYVCADADLPMFANYVARCTPFSDAEVVVASPQRDVLVSTWRPVTP